MKKVIRYIFIFICILILLLVGFFGALQIPAVQTQIIAKVLQQVNQQFGTTISIGKVELDFWGDIVLYDVSAKDHKQKDFIDIGKLTADLSLWDIYKNSDEITVKELNLDSARIKVITYKGDSLSNFVHFINRFVPQKKDTIPSNFKMNGNLFVSRSQLSIINENLPQSTRVWLQSKALNAALRKIKIEGNEYSADIEKLNFLATKNGENFQMKKFAAQFKMNDKGIFLNDFNITTQSSSLSGYLRLSHSKENGFADFSNKVNWDLLLNKGNTIGFKDLRYFMPDWDSSEILQLEGRVTGALNHINIQNLYIANGKTFIKTENAGLQDLLNNSYGVYTKQIMARTSYKDLIRILPSFIDKKLTNYIDKFGTIEYTGKLSLNEENLQTDGSLTSALGNAFLRLNLNDYSKNKPTYRGYLNTDGFDIGTLTGNKNLNKVAGIITFQGKSFDIKTMELNTNGKINYLDLAGQRYNNLSIDGVLKRETYDGYLSINDPTKAKLNYEGFFDFSKPTIKTNFISEIAYLNLNYFGVTNRRNSWIKTKIKGNATFSDINNLQGNFTLNNLIFNSDSLQVNFPKSDLIFAKNNDGTKNINLTIPHYLAASMHGVFKIEELGNLFQNGVGSFLVDYKKKKTSKGQFLDYSITVEDDFINYFLPDLKIKTTTFAQGKLNNDNDFFEIDFASPQIKYQDYIATDIQLSAQAGEDKFIHLTGSTVNIKNFLFKEIELNGKTINDTLNAKMHFFAGKEKTSEFNLNFYQTINEKNLVKVGFSPSQFNIEGINWVINPDNATDADYAIIDIDKGTFKLNSFSLQSDNQYLNIDGEYLNQNNFNLKANLQNLLLQKIIPPSYKGGLAIKGIANGTLNIKKENNNLEPIADLKIDSIQLNNRIIGNFLAEAKYDVDNQIFNITGSLDKNNLNTLYLNGDIDNKGKEPKIDLAANLDDFDIDILGIFLDEVMTDWKGKLSGTFNVKGKAFDPEIKGEAVAKDLGFKVVFLGTNYLFKGENELSLIKQPGFNGQIELDDLKFTETTSNTQGSVDGSLIFSDLSSWFLDLDFTTDKLLVMNTTIKNNELFYGRVLGEGEFFMFGPATDLVVSGRNLNILNGSVINLNTSGTKSAGESKFIQFYALDENGNYNFDEKTEKKISGFSIDLDLNVDSGTTVNLVLDEKSDDKIRAQGKAKNFKIAMNRAGNLNIEGQYNITKGTYNYREGVIVDKLFNIEKGGYIRFNGDPFNAQMNLRAIYTRSVSNVGEYLGLTYLQPTNVNLVISINGDLKNTNIDLGIELPNANSQIKTILGTKLKNNTDERIRQVGSIMVLGRFDSNETLSTNTARDAATASAFELLGKQVGNVFSSIIPGLEINPTYLQSNAGSKNQNDQIQTQFNLSLNPRLKINGAVGTPLGSQLNTGVTTSVDVDYDISKPIDGSLRLRGFSRPSIFGLENYNLNTTYAQSYGVGIIYQHSFDTFKDLFQFRKPNNDTIEERKTKKKKNKKQNDTIKKNLSFIKFK